MRKILITGEDSYIGTSFENWVSRWPNDYKVDKVSVRGEEWKDKTFSSYDVVYHVAAIVHVKESNDGEYLRVNRDLAVDVAKKAKREGVEQFIFLSTMGVYGMETGFIDVNTKTNPKTSYAKSKLEAEYLLNQLSGEQFKVVTLRPPIVYGKECVGNYSRLADMALKLPFYPKIENKRSMIFIDNLSEFVRLVINHDMQGLLFPQNKKYVNTTELVKIIAKCHGKELKLIRILNPLVDLGTKISRTFGKVFGSFVYSKELPGSPGEKYDYETCSFEKSIEQTEKTLRS